VTDQYSFPEIDKSYWLLHEQEWVANRKEQWTRIESMLSSSKSGKGKTAVKQYYLAGKMPDWEKFRSWNNGERHVDIFMFLWLHPSWDDDVLVPLRDAYMTCDLIIPDDIKTGFTEFIQSSTVMPTVDWAGSSLEEMQSLLITDGHNEQLFRLLMGDLNKKEYHLKFPDMYPPYSEVFKLPQSELFAINEMGRWLCIDEMLPINEDMLLQYDQPLEWWYESCTKDESYFAQRAQQEEERKIFRKTLFRIHHFDTQKEGDTCRTRFAHKIRKILDERAFIQEFKQMWLDVKAGNIEVKNAWEW
jgi:hypothetical protein